MGDSGSEAMNESEAINDQLSTADDEEAGEESPTLAPGVPRRAYRVAFEGAGEHHRP